MPDKVFLQEGDVFLVMVRDGTVFHYSRNMSLPHVEFVRRKTGGGPEGAWVGTVSIHNTRGPNKMRQWQGYGTLTSGII